MFLLDFSPPPNPPLILTAQRASRGARTARPDTPFFHRTPGGAPVPSFSDPPSLMPLCARASLTRVAATAEGVPGDAGGLVALRAEPRLQARAAQIPARPPSAPLPRGDRAQPRVRALCRGLSSRADMCHGGSHHLEGRFESPSPWGSIDVHIQSSKGRVESVKVPPPPLPLPPLPPPT